MDASAEMTDATDADVDSEVTITVSGSSFSWSSAVDAEMDAADCLNNWLSEFPVYSGGDIWRYPRIYITQGIWQVKKYERTSASPYDTSRYAGYDTGTSDHEKHTSVFSFFL